MKDFKNDIKLLIRKKEKNNLWKKLLINYSFLSDYDNILKEVNNTYYNKNIGKKDLRNIEIYLDHPKLNKIIVYNKEDWNFLYNNKIIKECISPNKIIKIDYKIINIIENNNEIIKQNNFKHILNYILENISIDYHSKIIFKFFNKYKEIKELFKLYFLNELINNCVGEIESKENEKNNDIIRDLDKLNENKININNKYLTKTEDFFDILKQNFDKHIIEINNYNNIKNVINSISKEEKEDFYKINEVSNYSEINDEESIAFIESQIFKDEKLEKKIIDENINTNEKIRKVNFNKYNSELTIIKDNLNRFICAKFNLN